ncbi:MAG TPA: GGDEF domain-containing protein [Gammaproteobacteria bacterium]
MQAQNEKITRQQRIRRKQVLTGFAVYATALVPLAYIDALGLLSLTDDEKIFLVIAALLTNGIFYGLIRYDVNLHFREPSMTFAQVMAATAWSLVIAWNVVQAARPLAMVWYLLAFLFGFYTLKRWQFLALMVFALAGYAIVVAREYFGGGMAAFRVELLHWLILAAGLFWMSLVGSYVSSLRQRLADQRRQLAEVAFTDPLTGVYNRRYLFDLLERERARIRRNHVATLAIAMLDLDDFKATNDRYGHPMGDRLLQRVADLLQDELRDMDAVGRFGGEEFIIVMPDTAEAGAKNGMERMRKRIESDDSPFRGVSVPVTVSVGVAELQPNETVAALLERADKALYAAKQAGRNRVVAASQLEAKNLRVVSHPGGKAQ